MLQRLLALAYPTRCGLCGVFGPSNLCDICLSEMISSERNGPFSGLPLAHRVSLFRYETRAAQAVRRLKYSRVTSLAEPMARLMREGYEASGLASSDLIVPIPIHWSRRASRGFNQAEMLCEALPTEKVRTDILHRVRPTKPQVGLAREERVRNLHGAFRATDGAKGCSVLLVDDVTTSGHTAEQCAEALLKAGAVEVSLLTFAGS